MENIFRNIILRNSLLKYLRLWSWNALSISSWCHETSTCLSSTCHIVCSNVVLLNRFV